MMHSIPFPFDGLHLSKVSARKILVRLALSTDEGPDSFSFFFCRRVQGPWLLLLLLLLFCIPFSQEFDPDGRRGKPGMRHLAASTGSYHP